MRLKVQRLWRAIKRELAIQFGNEQLTSYGGLELVDFSCRFESLPLPQSCVQRYRLK